MARKPQGARSVSRSANDKTRTAESGPSRGPQDQHAIRSYVHTTQRVDIKPYFRRPRSDARAANTTPWSVPKLCEAYEWPTDLAGGGVIAIVELGGGWVQSDMDQFFDSINQPLPQIKDVSVDGTHNNPNQHLGADDDPDGEVALDIQVAAAAYFEATGKPAVIRVYWARDIAAAVRAATNDHCEVCSISWGADEAKWGAKAAQEMEHAAADATAAGMIVFAASGDNDSSDGGPNPANVDLPSTAPHVIGCGGTTKTETTETVWNNDPGNTSGKGTGGGFSTLFKPMPAWQAGAPHGPGRMVPDVAANADPNTGYEVVVHGDKVVIGGTSAVAPLYAGLFAAFGTKLGFVTPELWLNHLCFNDITEGDNGAFRARVGPDACTGLGSPIGRKLAELLTHAAATPARLIKQLETENAALREQLANVARTRVSGPFRDDPWEWPQAAKVAEARQTASLQGDPWEWPRLPQGPQTGGSGSDQDDPWQWPRLTRRG
jgi:kumamolisin